MNYKPKLQKMTFDRFAQLYGGASIPETPAERLTLALERAKIAAAAYSDHEDGGTCNFDAPTIDYKAMGLSEPDATQAIRNAGLTYSIWTPGKLFRLKKLLVINGFTNGQGNRRTEMAQHFKASLQQDGIPCGMYYQMD